MNSRDLTDLDNPFVIVNSFFKKYPTKDLAKPHRPFIIGGYLKYISLSGKKKLCKGRYIFSLALPSLQSAMLPFMDIVIKVIKSVIR